MSRASRRDAAAAEAVEASFASAIAEATKWAAPPLKFSAGDKVQVRYLASSQGSARRPYWHDASVRVADARTGRYDVDFDDGDQESGVTTQHIRARPSGSAEAPATEPQPPIAVAQHAITVHTTAVTEVVELTAAVDPSDGLSEEVEVVAEVEDDDDQPLTEVVAEVEGDDDQPLTPDAQISQLPRGALVRLVRDAYASGGISAEAIVAAAAANPRKFARLPSERSAARALDPDYSDPLHRAHSLSAEEALAAAAAEGLELQRASSATGYLGVGTKGVSFCAYIRVAGKREFLGSFACAEEAALAYARRRDATRGPPPAPPVPRSDEPLTAEEARREAAAEGLELATTAKSSTGFEGVAECRGRDGRMIGRFKAEIRVNGRRECLGTYASAEEAALAVARRRQECEVEVRQGQKRYRDDE